MLSLIFLASLVTTNTYVWPSPQLDALESARFDQLGHNKLFGPDINPCNTDSFTGNTSGRSDAGDWIRTVRHSQRSQNRLDALIHFADEQSRPEATHLYPPSMFTVADSIAIGALLAIENCGGPEIAFRGGRADAGEPKIPGVLQPQQYLQSHIDSFARQVLTQTEMISLIACGHTFGGVQHAAFPDPEFNDTTNTLSVEHFDTTSVQFDNNIATEYISGSTRNPLVVGFNDSTNSDKRIFGSDGNATMASFAKSPALFVSTYADLFLPMLDTVPRGVQLTEVIAPLPVKPFNLQLLLDGDTLQFAGEVRLWNRTLNDMPTVSLLWDDRVGGNNNISLTPSGESTANSGRYTGVWYSFTIGEIVFLSLDAATGITSMRFLVNGTLENQGGLGFAVQDGVLFSTSSCHTSENPFIGRFDVGVRNGLNLTRVYLEQTTQDNVGRPLVVETDIPHSKTKTALPIWCQSRLKHPQTWV
ncbi:heme peroxidase [Mycena rosella]|uniref:Peroxidase n=1 Tax=Mycena rosella TaxID=1033263 RepID=A0AAD7CM99_MYCRO|nr:heme peroxidase [Mycena rosella]